MMVRVKWGLWVADCFRGDQGVSGQVVARKEFREEFDLCCKPRRQRDAHPGMRPNSQVCNYIRKG